MGAYALAAHAGVVLGGMIALHAFYRVVQTDWPQAYMSASDFAAHFVSTSLFRYLATYGIMQIRSQVYLTDEESIRLSCEGHLRDARPTPSPYGGPDHASLREIVERHNRDSAFVEMAIGAYWQLHHEEQMYHARLAMTAWTGAAMSVRNEGGGPAGEAIVLRSRWVENDHELMRTQQMQIPSGEELTIEAFDRVDISTLPEPGPGNVPAWSPGTSNFRVLWRNQDGSIGDSGWQSLADDEEPIGPSSA